MPDHCCAVGCTQRRRIGSISTVSFYLIPSLKEPGKRRIWLAAIKRKHWPTHSIKNARICSHHFASGRWQYFKILINNYTLIICFLNGKSNDPLSPDYVPSVNMGYTSKNKSRSTSARFNRTHRRNKMEDAQIGPQHMKSRLYN